MYQGIPHQQAQAFTVAHNPQKALADCGAASVCFAPWETPVCSRLFHGAKTFGDYYFNYISNRNEEKKEKKNNSPGYLSLSCASLGTWELPALSRIVVSSRR